MRKKLIIILSISTVLILGSIIALAAFVFTQTVSTTAKAGDITIEKEGYVSYALNNELLRSDFSSEAEFKAILKERAGGSRVDRTRETDTATTYGNYYTRTITEAETYTAGTKYFIIDDTNNYVYRDIQEFETGKTYYTINYTKATSNTGDLYRLGHKYDDSVNSNTNLTDYYVYSSTDLEGYAVFTPATSYTLGTKYYKLEYVPKAIKATSVITDTNSSNLGVSCVNTYGTQRDGSLAETGNYMYFNQLGFDFSIKTKVDCYVRIKFRDAWVSSKLYRGSSTPNERYTPKQQISRRSPFYVNDEDWYFDAQNNIAYYKGIMSSQDSSYNFSFDLDSTYFYESDATTYTERMIIQVSYSLEVIQANRIKAVWGISPSEIPGWLQSSIINY